ncbi:MAG: Ig-like domain-containing protein [bacterium]
MHAIALRRQLLGGAVIVFASAALACSSDSTATEVPIPVALVLTENSGVEAQTGVVGGVLATPISIKLTQSEQPLAGAVVSWGVRSGGGSVDAATSTTDASGDAVVHWTLGTVAGADTLIGTTSTGATSIITATAVAGPATTVSLVGGDGQTVSAGSAATPLIIKAVDQFGNGVSGAAVTWTVSGTQTLDNSTTTTDAGGQSQVVLTMSGTPGTYTITASLDGLAPVMFTEIED